MDHSRLVGQTLDGKYQIERELGSGGMGTVYLAAHLGTERPVAIKVISPQFMERLEFVERFRREARAAGRLRHPNVVDVTDFGFAVTEHGQVAYLVMEYLDGCTLGEILEEERNLPISWTLDIIEQVCSAVHEAHEQGIIHRDLKPDNIWLEPNQRGGYTVKVLDFGIAKLEAHERTIGADADVNPQGSRTHALTAEQTIGGADPDVTIHDSASATRVSSASAGPLTIHSEVLEKETMIQDTGGGNGNAFEERSEGGQDAVATRLIETGEDPIDSHFSGENTGPENSASAELTRVGSVLGTPLYMSPEQCRGDRLDARSDIYSIGVIAYQMLSGTTPFTGDFSKVMESHKFLPPPPLVAKGLRRKLKRVINESLAKDPAERPSSAEAFASSLRSRSEGIFGLLRRAGMIYTEHLQKFLAIAVLFFLPIALLTFLQIVASFLRASEIISATPGSVALGLLGSAHFFITAFCVYLITGTITWVVAQSLAVPLRPIRLRAALAEARTKWRTFAGLGILSALIPVVVACGALAAAFIVPFAILWAIFGFSQVIVIVSACFGGIAGITAFVLFGVWLMLVAPVAMMENLRGLDALRRSRNLVSRSPITATSAYLIMFLMPAIAAGILSFMISVTAKAFDNRPSQGATEIVRQVDETSGFERRNDDRLQGSEVKINIGRQRDRVTSAPKDMREQLRDTFFATLLQILLLPIQTLVISFTAIIVALLYLKTRQAGGEPLKDLLSKFEDSDQPRKKWQERVRQRLIQSGRISSST
ncbi:MAG TPA: protein kinase [Pyrinomonadaceae bacterium]|nr:protein kinase [Pyrinomonadaceae bacterium]